MLRVLVAIGGTAIVFAAALIIGGELFGAWAPAKPVAASRPDAARPGALVEARTSSSPRPKSKRPSRPPARQQRAPKPNARSRQSWVMKLNGLCRSAEAEVFAIPPPQTPAEARQYFQTIARLSERWNGAAAKPLALAARTDSRSVRRLFQLFEEERGLMADAVAAVEARDSARYQRLAPRFLANGREQSRLLVGLGAEDCAVPDYQTYLGG
jgi:hypothetical protein